MIFFFVHGAQVRDPGVEFINCIQGVGKANPGPKPDIETFPDQENLSFQLESLVTVAKRFVDGVRIREFAHDIMVRARDTLEHEGTQGMVVDLPDLAGSRVSRRVRARNTSIKPIRECMLVHYDVQASTLFLPIGLLPIQD